MHWSERTSCLCGKTFKVGSNAESVHRHNFPILCKKRKVRSPPELAAPYGQKPLK